VQSPSWEANWFAASQEIPRISRNPNVHYRTHKRPPPVSILGQPNPVHMPTSHLLEIHPNIIHPSTPRSPQWSLSLRFMWTIWKLKIKYYKIRLLPHGEHCVLHERPVGECCVAERNSIYSENYGENALCEGRMQGSEYILRNLLHTTTMLCTALQEDVHWT